MNVATYINGLNRFTEKAHMYVVTSKMKYPSKKKKIEEIWKCYCKNMNDIIKRTHTKKKGTCSINDCPNDKMYGKNICREHWNTVGTWKL